GVGAVLAVIFADWWHEGKHKMKRYLLLGLLIILAACGGPSSPSPSDITAPLLSSSLPATGSNNVPINVKLAFGFNEAIDEASLTLSATPTFNLGSPNWTSDHKNVVFTNDLLSPSTSYSLLLNAKDLAGNALASTTLTFNTSASTDTTAPSTPTNLIASPGNAQISLSWQASPETDVVGYTIYLGTTATQLEQHSLVTETSSTVTGLDNAKAYFFALDAVDNSGNHSSQSGVVSATPSATDVTAPTIVSSSPADDATDVHPNNPTIKLVFSEPMDIASFSLIFLPPNPTENIVVSPHTLGPLTELEPLATTPFNVSWSEADTVATLTLVPPDVLLLENTTFTLTLSAKDKAGNALAGNKEITFKTGKNIPRLVSSVPADGASNVEASNIKATAITLTFSEEVKLETFEVDDTNFPYGCLIQKSEVVGVTVALTCNLFDGNTYTLPYKGQDLDSNAFEGSISFSTVPDTVPPSVFFTNPNDLQMNVPLTQEIEIGFDDEMDEVSTLAAVTSSPDLGCTWTLSETKDFLICKGNLQGNTNYEITVAETAKDTSGKELAGSGLCRGDPPCSYVFTFTTLTPPPSTGNLKLTISGLPFGQKRVRVLGPSGFNSGLLDEGSTFSNLSVGDYTITAASFTVAPGKPACRIYFAEPSSQTITVSANQTKSASVTYTNESCAL
ncbi:MAG: Ig-like domain-containing protein, partial [Trueperaceae bacterium]|nr:Ig-like domain-containing protein [Trueperaceae bacterium]